MDLQKIFFFSRDKKCYTNAFSGPTRSISWPNELMLKNGFIALNAMLIGQPF